MMGERIPPGSYFQYPPSGVPASPYRASSLPTDRDRYLAELLAEKHKLVPFTQVLPLCTRLVNQEIRRVSSLTPSFVDQERFEHDSPFRSFGQHPNGRQMDLEGWSVMQTEENGHMQRVPPIQAASVGWPGLPRAPTTPIVKRVVRLDVPVDKYPNEEKLKDKPGYEHLNEPLHVLVEAEFPEDMVNSRLEYAVAILENLLKPVDESLDSYKKQQLRELALLNGTLREESPSMSPSMSPGMSPFNSTGMKRAKTGR
ncbi:hypothetical protein E1A91_A12G047000v1 [Gossypium mustelinum]|uniref:STAR protein homodimerisation region domain-containing protein n=1 Tax=Gossypium mustelinum TaxID=34275 RepID=A0A5D2WQ52_GOSMU|nr:hypothetical protein E1A91_A12G047000v1 [Gossypium mustelinum]